MTQLQDDPAADHYGTHVVGQTQMYNTFCKLAETFDPQTLDPNREFHELLLDLRRLATEGAVFTFDQQDYTTALASAVEDLGPADWFYPPAMPFQTTLLLDPFSIVGFSQVQDYVAGVEGLNTEEVSALQHGFPEQLENTNFVLRRGVVTSFTAANSKDGMSGAYLAVADFTILTPTADSKFWKMILSFPRMLVFELGSFDKPKIDITPSEYDRIKHLPVQETDLGAIYLNLYRTLSRELSTGLEQLAYIDLPRHHVIQERPIQSPRDIRRQTAGVKLPRYDRIPKYRLIEPEKIRTIYVQPETASTETTRRTVTPHGRRGYTRYLQSARFVNKRWQRIRIRPTWYGSDTWEFNKLRYRVIRPSAESETPIEAGTTPV